ALLRQKADEEIRRKDIQLKKSEEELSSAQGILKGILDNIPGPVYSRDLKGNYIYMNEAFRKLLGKAPEREFTSLDNEWLDKNNNGNEICNVITRIELDQGRVHYFDTYKFPLRDTNGNVYSVTSLSVDITDKKSMEEQLEKERALLIQASKLSSLGEMAA